MKRFKLLALGLSMAFGISVASACAPEQSAPPPQDPSGSQQTTGEIKAGTFTQTEEYFVGQQISLNFKQLFTNTTGKALAFTATPGSITSSGQWTWTPDKAGETDVSITASVGEGEELISDTLSFKLTITAVAKIRGIPFRQTEQYRSGDEISVDVKPLFDKDADVGELAYTASFGNIANGVWTYTADKVGVLSPRITATSGDESGALDLYVTVTGGFAPSESEKVVINAEELTISDYTVKAGEEATISGRAGDYAETTLLVPAKEAEPVLTFMYKGVCPGSNGAPAPMLYAYDAESEELLAVLYNGFMAKSGGKGQGMGVDTGLNTEIGWQPYAFDLNRFFKLDEEKLVKFRFADGYKDGVINGEAIGDGTALKVDMGGSADTSASYAAVNVAAKTAAGTIEASNGVWTPLLNSENNKVEKTEKGIKLSAKGTGEEVTSTDAVVAAVLLDNGESTLTNYKITVTGTGKYRLYAFAVDANNAGKVERATVAAFEYLRPGGYYNGSETSKGDLGWQQADEHGDVLWYPGSASVGNMHVAVAVFMCASEEDAYINVTTGGEGVYASKSNVDLGSKNTFEDITYDFSKNFYSVFNGVNTFVQTYTLGEGAPGSINPTTGEWTANLDTAGEKSFTVKCSAAQYSDEITVTLAAQARLVVEPYEPEKTEYNLGETLSVDFSEYVKNSTETPVTYSVNEKYGEIDESSGAYTFKPTKGGSYDVKVEVHHGADVRTIEFTVKFNGNIGVDKFDVKEVYDLGTEYTIDFSKYFHPKEEATLTYSAEGLGSIDSSSGILTFTPDKGGMIPVEITAHDAANDEDAVLDIELCVKAELKKWTKSESDDVTVNQEELTIGKTKITAGEQATLKNKGGIETTLKVPSKSADPVLTLLYAGKNDIKVRIHVYRGEDLIAYLYKNDASNGSDSGLGVKSSAPDNVLSYQILAFELNKYFDPMGEELTFVFENVASGANKEFSIANVAVVPKAYLNSMDMTDGGSWTAMYDDAENTMSVNGNTLRLDVKGNAEHGEDTVFGAYNTYYVTTGINAGGALRFWVKGNAEYRIMLGAIYTKNTAVESNQVTRMFPFCYELGNANTYSAADKGADEARYNGWLTAKEGGMLVYYNGSNSLINTQLTIFVMVRASEQDTYLEVCDTKYAEGSCRLAESLSLKATKDTPLTIDFNRYLGFAGAGSATFSLEGENCGAITEAGLYTFTPAESGKYTFTVKATKDAATVSIAVTISVEGELSFGEFEVPWNGQMLSDDLQFTQDFTSLLTNTTGYDIASWSADVGTIADGVWTYKPETSGDITVTITAETEMTPFGKKSARLEFTISIKGLVEATGEYEQEDFDIIVGTQTELDFNGLFTYEGDGDLEYSLENAADFEGASFSGSKLTVTFKNGGVNLLQVKATGGGQSAVLTAKVSVRGIFVSGGEKATVSDGETTISGKTFKAGEVVTLTDGDGVSATQTINIPATEDHPYLYFYYKGKNHPQVYVSLTDKDQKEYVLYDGNKAGAPKYGAGMGIGTKAATSNINLNTVWLMHVIDLTLIKDLNIATPETFTVTVKDLVPSTDSYYKAGDFLCFAGMRVITAEELGGSGNIGNIGSNGNIKIENAEFSLVTNDDSVTFSQKDDKTVKLDIKGIEGNKDTTSALFFTVNSPKQIAGYDGTFFVKGNASYRILYSSVKPDGSSDNWRWLAPGAYGDSSDGNDFDMEWYTAQERGGWHGTKTNNRSTYEGYRLTYIVLVRASEQDTWLEVTSGYDAPSGVYLRSEVWDNTVRYDNNTGAKSVKANSSITLAIYSMFYCVKAGEGNCTEKVEHNTNRDTDKTKYTFEIMKDGQVTTEYGTIDAANGTWTHTFTEAGTYEFVIRGKAQIDGQERYADLNMKITVT